MGVKVVKKQKTEEPLLVTFPSLKIDLDSLDSEASQKALSVRYSPFSNKSRNESVKLKQPKNAARPIIPQKETLRLLETKIKNVKLAADSLTGVDINLKNTKATNSLLNRLERDRENEFLSVEALKQDDHAYLDYFREMDSRMEELETGKKLYCTRRKNSKSEERKIMLEPQIRKSYNELKNSQLENSHPAFGSAKWRLSSGKNDAKREVVVIRKKKWGGT